MEKAIGYIRVSTKMQEDEGISLEAQLDKVQTYCKLKDFEFIGYETDTISGKEVENRPGIQKVIRMAQTGEIQHIVVLRYERAFRNTLDTLRYIEEFAKLNVGFHSIKEQMDTTTPLGKLMVTMIAGLNEFEARKISERTKEVLEYKRSVNQRFSRFASFGTKLGDQTLSDRGRSITMISTDNREIEAIKIAKELFITQAMPLRKIAAQLADSGYLSRTHKPYNASSIKKMLSKSYSWE